MDSTKDPSYAYVLRDVPGIDLRVINLVRDSRGVAYSNAKPQIIRPELAHNPSTKPVYMPTWPLWRTAVSWEVKNLLFYLLIRAPERRLVKYESLVACPSGGIRGRSGTSQVGNGVMTALGTTGPTRLSYFRTTHWAGIPSALGAGACASSLTTSGKTR